MAIRETFCSQVRGRVDRRPAWDRYRPDEKDWRASHDLKRRPFELDGFQPRRQEPAPGIVAPKLPPSIFQC
jgi:hypothetical protein